MTRHLIVNADDFGLSPGVNKGIIRAHEQGVVTSASLMTRGAGAEAAAEYARAHAGLAVGLHVDMGEWVWRAPEWVLLREVVPGGDPHAVRAEVHRQLKRFVELLGSPPTHLDSHQHLHRKEPLKTILLECARDLNIPLRGFSSIRHEGRFYGQSAEGSPLPECVTTERFLQLVREMPEGWTEIACHPGLDPGLDSVYAVERAKETETLCDPALRVYLSQQAISLGSFREFRP